MDSIAIRFRGYILRESVSTSSIVVVAFTKCSRLVLLWGGQCGGTQCKHQKCNTHHFRRWSNPIAFWDEETKLMLYSMASSAYILWFRTNHDRRQRIKLINMHSSAPLNQFWLFLPKFKPHAGGMNAFENVIEYRSFWIIICCLFSISVPRACHNDHIYERLKYKFMRW